MGCSKKWLCLLGNFIGIAFLWLLCPHDADAGPFKQVSKVDESLVQDMLSSLEKAIGFFEQDYSYINMDGLYGLRICQGQIIDCLQECASDDFQCPPEVLDRLETISNKLKTIGDTALPYVEEKDPPYAFMYIHNINSPFHVKYIPELLGDADEPIGTDTAYNGHVGDACFSGMMGTAIDNQGSNILSLFPKCTMDEDCWNVMVKPNTFGYYLTHQLLYFIYGDAIGCASKLNKVLEEFNGETVRSMERGFCRRIISETKQLSKDGTVDIFKQDLFIEQSMVCGMLGFQDFFSPDWMRMVISWQSANGCWSTPRDLYEKEIKKIEIKEILQGLNLVPTRRKLLEERWMSGDCLSHLSGLATGTLGVYMRFLINHLYRLD